MRINKLYIVIALTLIATGMALGQAVTYTLSINGKRIGPMVVMNGKYYVAVDDLIRAYDATAQVKGSVYAVTIPDSKQTATTAAPVRQEYGLIVRDCKISLSGVGSLSPYGTSIANYKHITTGYIENVSSVTYKLVNITLNYYDSRGTQVGSRIARVTNLISGTTAKFVIDVPGNSASNVAVIAVEAK
jgi:hypothetical protein